MHNQHTTSAYICVKLFNALRIVKNTFEINIHLKLKNMKKLFTIILLAIVIIGFAQSENFTLVNYKINDNDVYHADTLVKKDGYTSFMLYKEKPFFMLGFSRDSSYSYGFIKKLEEYEIEPQDSATLVIYGSYNWNYANSYNFNTGVAKIETYRIFYKTSMYISIIIYINDESKKEDDYNIKMIAINEDY